MRVEAVNTGISTGQCRQIFERVVEACIAAGLVGGVRKTLGFEPQQKE
jgi:hypothetical protein